MPETGGERERQTDVTDANQCGSHCAVSCQLPALPALPSASSSVCSPYNSFRSLSATRPPLPTTTAAPQPPQPPPNTHLSNRQRVLNRHPPPTPAPHSRAVPRPNATAQLASVKEGPGPVPVLAVAERCPGGRGKSPLGKLLGADDVCSVHCMASRQAVQRRCCCPLRRPPGGILQHLHQSRDGASCGECGLVLGMSVRQVH